MFLNPLSMKTQSPNSNDKRLVILDECYLAKNILCSGYSATSILYLVTKAAMSCVNFALYLKQ